MFFGGGTPSLLDAAQLARILDAIPRTPGAEVTVECNPDSVDRAKFDVYAAAGVNRLSFGVQSMRTHVLASLGRTHDPANVTRAVEWARAAGFTRLNLDLIYGSPGESLDDWRATLDAALALEPSHVSAYALTVEPGTPLGRAVAAGERAAPDDDDQADQVRDRRRPPPRRGLRLVRDLELGPARARSAVTTSSTGNRACTPGSAAAAHGHTEDRDGWARRWWNLRTPDRYLAAVAAGDPTEAGDERLDPATREAERLTLMLRTRGRDQASARRRRPLSYGRVHRRPLRRRACWRRVAIVRR